MTAGGRWVLAGPGTQRPPPRGGLGGGPARRPAAASPAARRVELRRLFLWQRIGAERLAVRGDRALLDRYFVLVPPL